MDACYRLDNIRTIAGNRQILAIDELELRRGQSYLLTGPNGAGKSTLLSHLALLSAPTFGTIRFNNTKVSWNSGALLEMRRSVTLLHQTPFLFDGCVASNVGYGLKLRGIKGDILNQRVSDALDQVGLTGFEKRAARQLSGGEAQRVALARALVLETSVLLLDEPLASVDRGTSRIIENLLPRITEKGTTIVMTSHDPDHTRLPGWNMIRLAPDRQPHAVSNGVAVFVPG